MAGPMITAITFLTDSVGGSGGSPYAAATWNTPYTQVANLFDSHVLNVSQNGAAVSAHADTHVTVTDYTGATARSHVPATVREIIDALVSSWAEIVGVPASTFHTATVPATLAALSAAINGGTAATSAATASALVKRDGSGGAAFAGTLTGAVGSFSGAVTATAFHGPADSALGLTLPAVQNQVAFYNGTIWTAGSVTGAMVGLGALTDDRLAGLWYTISPLNALKVRVAGKNIWNTGSFIQFAGTDSPTIDPTGIGIGQARIDLLYIDQAGALQWQLGTPAQTSSAGLPTNPSNAFIPIVYVKVYNGAASITGYADAGHDANFFADARLPTNPLGVSAIARHSLPFDRMQDAAAFASSPASTTINVSGFTSGGYFNSQGVFTPFTGGAYTYLNSALTNVQPRWDLLYLDDSGNLSVASGTPAASPAKPSKSTAQWPIAYVYIPVNCVAIVDVSAYNFAVPVAGQGYILPAPAYLATIAPINAGTTAVATCTVSGGAVQSTITITTPGSGYATPPAISFVGGGGTGATATANIASGAVTSIVLTAGGTGYTTPPTIVFTAGGGVTDVAHGGTNATSQGGARSNLGAAASALNGDITGMTALTAITGSITITSNALGNIPQTVAGATGQSADLVRWQSVAGTNVGGVSALGTIGQGVLPATTVGFFQGGTLAPGTNSAFGIAQNNTLKPGATGGTASWIHAANGGVVDMSALTAVNASVTNAYGVYVGPISRSGSNPSVYAIQTLTPTLATTGGSYTTSDGTNTTAAIAHNAVVGDTVTVGTINYALAHATPAAIDYTATGGPLSANSAVTFTANTTNPGKKAIFTLGSNTVTGGTISFALTAAGNPYIANAYGGYFSQPTGGQTNKALYIAGDADGTGKVHLDSSAGVGIFDFPGYSAARLAVVANLSAAGTASLNSANEGGINIQVVIPVTSSTVGYEKDALSVNMISSDPSAGGINRDATALAVRNTASGTSTTTALWGLYVENNYIVSGTDGSSVGFDFNLTKNFGTDNASYQATQPQNNGLGAAIRGSVNGTSAFYVGTGGTAGWHRGFLAYSEAIASGANDTAFEVYSQTAALSYYGIYKNGRLRVSKTSGDTAVTATFDASVATTNGQKHEWDRYGHDTITQLAAPTGVCGIAAGATPPTPTITGTDEAGTISITAAASGTGANNVIAVSFKNAYAANVKTVHLTPGSSAAAAIMGSVYIINKLTGGFTIFSTVALTSGAAYLWDYVVKG